MASVLVPVLYVIVVFGSLIVFSYFYRKSTAARRYEPYFPTHVERNLYVSLLQRSDPPTSDSLLKATLIRRAMADVHRVMRIREDKPALQNLLQKGSIGEDLWNSLLSAEKELEAEIMEVVAEANSFVEGWGQMIFQTANEMIANEKMRAVFEQTAEARTAKESKYGKKSTKSITSPQASVSNSSLPHHVSNNGLVPPLSAGAESAASSEGEGSPSPTSLKTSSKSPGKKNKKRK